MPKSVRGDSLPDTYLDHDVIVMGAAQEAVQTAIVGDRDDCCLRYANVSKGIASDIWALHYATLKKIGWAINFVDDAESKTGQPLPGALSVYVCREIAEKFDRHTQNVDPLQDMLPWRIFLNAVVTCDLPLDPTDERCVEVAASMPPHIDDSDRDLLVRRGGLTSALLLTMKLRSLGAQVNPAELDPTTDTNQRYETWRSQGIQPFTLAQLQQYAEAGVRHQLEITPQ